MNEQAKEPRLRGTHRTVHDIEVMAQAEAKRQRKRRKRLKRIRHKKTR